MPKNHAKTIKGMSIACIALAGLSILVCLVALGALAVFGPMMEEALYDPYAYDYGYGYGWDDYDSIFGAYGLTASLDQVHGHLDHGYSSYYLADSYGSLAEAQLAITMLNVMFVIALIGQCIELVASIIILKNHNKPEKFGMAFAWSIVGAVLSLLSGSVVATVLFIIIAVFVNSDKKLYQAGMYFTPAPGAVPGYPMPQPGAPVAPVAPVAPATPAVPAAPVAPAAAVPVQPVQDAQPAQPATQVTTAEVYQPAGQPALVPGETQPPAPAVATTAAVPAAETATAVVETVETTAVPATDPAAADATVVEAVQAEAIVETPVEAPAGAPVEAPADTPAPVVVDDGAVIKLDIDGDQPAEK